MSLSFNIFNGTTSDDIRVGYIDPELGYVSGVSKCEANEYAFNNPGTTFIFETREKIRYLNINEVNALTPNDLPSSLDTCTGIQVEGEPDPPSVGFFGGGGVGAIANPIFGLDGSLMAVDVVRGGHGYQYPPVVKVTDETGIGAGAVTRAILVGDPDYPECEFVETEEVFDQEDDFEDYQLCEDPEDDFGERYDTDGKSLGKWNPNAYASFDQDPIEQEIQRYQEFLRELDNPWWTSRKEAPIRITSDTRRPTTRVKYDVVHPAWGIGPEFAEFDPVDNTKYLRAPIPEDTFMNRYAISPVPPSNALGSDFDADTFNIFWEENFPFPGNYRFEAQGDSAIMNVYVDGTLLGRASDFSKKNKPAVFKKQLSEGVHEIRVELKNGATEIAEQPWNANPMGIALAIVAPLPPIPVKELPPQDDCPSIPFWTTRFPTNNLWWPVTLDDRWSQFMNRYAISPVPPLATESSDQGGTVFSTSWSINAPYDGYYGIKGAVDNGGRILVDGSEVMSGGLGYRKSGLAGFRNNNPQTVKVFLSEGRHTITTEVINEETTVYEQIDRKIFNTADWLVPPPKGEEQAPGTLFVNEGGQYYMLAGGNDLIEVDFGFNWNDDSKNSGYLRKVTIETENGPLVFERASTATDNPIIRQDRGSAGRAFSSFTVSQRDRNGSIGKSGTFKTGKKYLVTFEGQSGSAGFRINDTGIEFDDNASNSFDVNSQFTALSARNLSGARVTPSSGTKTINGVTYSGPDITSYLNDPTDYLGPLLTPVYQSDETYESTHRDQKWIMTWSNVDFPETGQYKLEVLADDILIVRVDGVDVGQAEVFKGVNITYFNVPAGKRTVELELVNADLPGDFSDNPTYAFARITKKVKIDSGESKPWTENPVGISAIMIPPPCPKKEKGKGVICRVLVDDPGSGFSRPQGQGYPVGLELQSVEVETPGINYRCGEDQIIIEPSNGAELSYECDTFGRIVKVNVTNPGFGFTRTPRITIPSETGVNATFRPQFRVVRDPIVIDPEQTILQVTDLAGLKQTGYVDGRAYYGAVFYQEGVRYAGYYQTPGQLVQVYDTLQESIDAQVITPTSAIIRQGTDIRSNDPRLNIPGTPDEIN